MAAVTAISTGGILRHSIWDALFVALALGHGVVLATQPPLMVIAIGFWWNANTISHNFVHLPFFRSRSLNISFSAYLSLVLGIPQSLWRDRHLSHHAERPWRLRVYPQLVEEFGLVALLWFVLAQACPDFLCQSYLPGLGLGLALCYLQGHFEHASGTTSHYGRCYNFLFFNDGFHREHHERPSRHWRTLPSRRSTVMASHYPAILRWLEWVSLDNLERLALKSKTLQEWLIRKHKGALRRLWGNRTAPRQVVVVGGGLFPRTALLLHQLWPEAEVTIMETNETHIACAQHLLPYSVRFQNCHYDPMVRDQLPKQIDLLIVPLAFHGEKKHLYGCPPAPQVLVHDWLWRREGASTVVSLALFKRMNLMEQ